MLLTLLLVLQQPPSGIARFHEFFQKASSFSVRITAHSNRVPVVGKGTLLVSKPDSFRLKMDWDQVGYDLVKTREEMLEVSRYAKIYHTMPDDPGLIVHYSAYPILQEESLPLPFLVGDLTKFVPPGTTFKTIGKKDGVETDKAVWSGAGTGRVTVKVASDGRLVSFEAYSASPNGIVQRTFEFSDYNLAPPIPSGAFSTQPPTGFVAYQLPTIIAKIAVGEKLKLGSWTSGSEAKNLDEVAKGKLLVVRESDSPPADALLGFLANQKLPADKLVLSLDGPGGDYHSPDPKVADSLASMGTPLIILLDAQGAIKGLWLGYDPDRKASIVPEITRAYEDKGDG